MILPDYLIQLGTQSADHQAWLDSLPAIVGQLAKDWKLSLGKFFTQDASCSLIIDCKDEEGQEVVLKIGFPHFEAQNEIEGLETLKGEPTVQLLQFDKSFNAMLLEKCTPGTSLKEMELSFQDKIICKALPKIWATRVKDNIFQPLSNMIELWNAETYESLDTYPDPSLAKQGCYRKERLIKTTRRQALLATDLHAGNVLRADRKQWLVIDIKPFLGDPAYDLTQHIINTIEELKQHPIDRINKLAELANVSPIRLRDWVFARLASEFGGIYQDIALVLK